MTQLHHRRPHRDSGTATQDPLLPHSAHPGWGWGQQRAEGSHGIRQDTNMTHSPPVLGDVVTGSECPSLKSPDLCPRGCSPSQGSATGRRWASEGRGSRVFRALIKQGLGLPPHTHTHTRAGQPQSLHCEMGSPRDASAMMRADPRRTPEKREAHKPARCGGRALMGPPPTRYLALRPASPAGPPGVRRPGTDPLTAKPQQEGGSSERGPQPLSSPRPAQGTEGPQSVHAFSRNMTGAGRGSGSHKIHGESTPA